MKGQSSLDALIMMGLGLVLAASFFYVANIMISDSVAAGQADDAITKISNEIEYVYSSGKGTVRYVDITIPSGVEEINIDEFRVHMRVQLSSGSSDYFSNTNANLVGSIPAEPGVERVVVRYLDSGNIQVGTLQLTASPKSMYFYLPRSGSDSDEILVENNADFTINGIGAALVGLSDMIVITNPAASLAAGENDTIDVTVNIPADKPSGTYNGYVRVDSSNGGYDDVLISITVQGGSPASCTLSPASAELSLGQSQPFTANCVDGANETVACPLMTWSTDAGSLIPIVSYSTSTLVATLTDGSFVSAQNGINCNADVTVSGSGPLVSALFTTPSSPITAGSVTINATGDDTGRGNMNISLCQVRIDADSWQAMNTNDGAYDEIIEDVSLNVGILSDGQHTARVRCNNTEGDFGSQASIGFRVDQNGPLVTALFSAPATIIAGNSITINATGDDAGLGDSNVSMCQVSVDGAAYLDMTTIDGAYDEVAESVYRSIGPKSVGQHNATVKCNDSAGITGPTSTINFTVTPKPILFITNGASPSTAEQYWLTWISAHSSGLGFNWSVTRAQDSAVVSGTTNATDYKIVMMAEYDTGIGQNTTLKNFQNSGGMIVLLGAALQNGPQRLEYTASGGTSDGENEIWIVNNAHYITSGFASGRLRILGSTEVNWRNTDNLGGTILADGMNSNKDNPGQPVLDSANKLITWGPTRPDAFDANGNTITTRILDYALNASTIGG